jgi:hypothetical protein
MVLTLPFVLPGKIFKSRILGTPRKKRSRVAIESKKKSIK